MFDPNATLLAANSIFTVVVEGASDAGAAAFLRGGSGRAPTLRGRAGGATMGVRAEGAWPGSLIVFGKEFVLAEGPHPQPENGASSGDARSESGVGWLDVLLIVVVYLLISVLAGSAVGVLGPSLFTTAGVLLILATSAGAAIASVAIVVVARGHLVAASVGLRRVSARWLLAGVGLGLVGWLLTRGVVLAYFWVTGDTTNPQAGLVSAAQGTLAQFGLTLLVAGLAVPFGEELLYRGVLYTWLRRWGIVIAASGSALIFGFTHGLNVVFPATVLLGVLLALAYERSGSIWPGVVGHVVYNLLVFSAARLLVL